MERQTAGKAAFLFGHSTPDVRGKALRSVATAADAAPLAALPLPIRRAKTMPERQPRQRLSTLRRPAGVYARQSQRPKTKPMESGPCLPLPLVAPERKETERTMQQPNQSCTCVYPARVNQLCLPCRAEWDAWLEEHMRQQRMYAAYGDPYASQEPAA